MKKRLTLCLFIGMLFCLFLCGCGDSSIDGEVFHPRMIIGKWVIPEIPDQEIVFAEDGTCILHGIEYNWKYRKTWSDQVVRLDLFQGDNRMYQVQLFSGVEYGYRKILNVGTLVGKDVEFTREDAGYIHLDSLQKVELTMDNFDTYFERVDIVEAYKEENDTGVNYRVLEYLVPRAEYVDKVRFVLSSGVIEADLKLTTAQNKAGALDNGFEPGAYGEHSNRMNVVASFGEIHTEKAGNYNWGVLLQTAVPTFDAKDSVDGYISEYQINKVQGVMYLYQ